MRERQNAKSLGAVHTHTHTHTHTHKSLFNGKIWPFKDVMSTKQICWTVWREQCLVKTVFGFVAKEGKKEQEKSKFREGSLSKVASKKINKKQKENEYKWEKRVDCI